MTTKEEFNNALFENVIVPEALKGFTPTLESLFERIAENALNMANRAFEEGANYAMDKLRPSIEEVGEKIDDLAVEVSWDVQDLKNNLDFKFLKDERDK